MSVVTRWALCIVFAAGVGAAQAHPLVSTDINRHVTLTASRAGLSIRYLYNMLEVAAVNQGRAADTDADGQVSDAERERYTQDWARSLQRALQVTLDDTPLRLQLRTLKWELGPAPFGLHTWTLSAELEAPWQGRAVAQLRYRDHLRPGETGWKEVILRATDIALRDADVRAADRSALLTDYRAMADLPNPDQTAARARLVFDAPAATAATMKTAVPQPDAAVAAPSGTASIPTPSSEDPAPAATAPPAPSPWQHYALPFFRLGMHHIAVGWDHLAFLLGLLLFRQRLAHLAWVVTAFTLAHSLTLALAASGWVRPPGQWVESLIAVSIAYVGVMALWKPAFRHGPWLAFGFGLVHGFGFAGALSEALGDLGGRAWLVALAAFNLGIEALQLCLVGAAFGLLRGLDRASPSVLPRRALACLVIALGVWWTVERVSVLWLGAPAG